MNNLIEILHKEFKVQPSDNEVRKWLNEKIPFKSTYILKTEERARNWDFINKFMENGEQPLQLGYSVPCNEKGEVLERPIPGMCFDVNYYKEYQKAKESVIYEGFEVDKEAEEYGKILFINLWDWFIHPENGIHLADNKGNYKIRISDMEGQPITKQFWINFIK